MKIKNDPISRKIITPKQFKAHYETPCLIIDLDVLDQNLGKMQDIANMSGKRLRPHAKTHKCSALAKKQIALGASGVCVARLSEAEVLTASDVNDILITGPVVTKSKIQRLVDLIVNGKSVKTVVDNKENISMLNVALKERGVSMEVLLDLDVGMHRTGIRPSEALDLARQIVSASNLCLRGVQAYAGHVQHIQSYENRKIASHKCMAEAVQVFRMLQDLTPECEILSTSGTGTYDIDLAFPEITELQVGSYIFMDSEYLAIGSAQDSSSFVTFKPALHVLTTVVSVNHEDFVTVDAGLKSIYNHGGIPRVINQKNSTLCYDWFGDEYGKVSSSDNADLPRLGSIVELITSHCDPTVNLYDNYTLLCGGSIVGKWAIDLRGRSQ